MQADIFVRVNSIRMRNEHRNAFIIDIYLVEAEKLAVGGNFTRRAFYLTVLSLGIYLPL